MAAFYPPYMYDSFIRGNMHNTIRKLHQKYGPIVRVGPDPLATDGSIGWPEVYGHKAGQRSLAKCPNFSFRGDATALIAAPKGVHRRQRRHLAHAFSDSALRGQESVMKQYVDLLMSRFAARADTGESFNVVKWFDLPRSTSSATSTTQSPFIALKTMAINLGYPHSSMAFAVSPTAASSTSSPRLTKLSKDFESSAI